MNHNETRGTVIEVVDIKSGGQTYSTLKRNVDATFTVGGIFSDSELAWLYHGAYLKVVSVSDGAIQSSWDFSSITRDNKTEITNVIEYEISEHGNRNYPKESQFCLIVSYTSSKDSNKVTYISFIHPRTSKMLHTITTREKVTCMSLITTRKDHSCPIGGIVKMMSGALAIGTESGNLLIMDIKGYDLIKEVYSCSRKNNLYDLIQNRFSCMLVLDLKQHSESEIKDRICKVDDDDYHVTVSIPVSDRRDTRDNQSICSMMYISQGLTLAVGLRSGVFQLWDVSSLKKLYKSSSLSVPTPVVKFGFQEPCNDPQNFCYLWVLHESSSDEDNCLPFAVMYGILYKKVVVSSDYGRYYKSFVHCKKRFDMDVDMEGSLNGRCIACSVVSNTPSNMLRHITGNEVKSHRDGISEEDPSKINLFAMAFETWDHKNNLNSHISLVVFDMNQWYKAQMPHQCYHGYSVPFVNFVLLDRVSERRLTILDMLVKKDTIQQFLTFNLSEEYSYPSSLSFDTLFLTNAKLIHLRIPGVQRCIIEQIVSEGPNCLINPGKYFTECKEAGLRPCFADNYGHVIVPSQIQQRNYILTILLEHKMSNFLVRCVNEWADGSRAVSGCTLPNLIQWAWDCVTRIKQLTDTICVPLFDYSGDDLDRENYQKLKHCSQLLQLIRDFLNYVAKNFKHYLLEYKKLNYQVETLQLVTKFFNVIIWCLDVGLLPEKVTSSSDRCIPTYMASLMQYTEQRREELKLLAMKDKYFLKEESTCLYLIDSVLENEAGGKFLRQQWDRESCGMTNGFYPSVTLQSLLRMFLMPELSTDMKHFIMMYFLLDVCDYHRDEDMKEQLLSFSIIFFPDSKFMSLVEGCWLIDHEKFEEASAILQSDAVINYLKENQNLYDTILKSCVCQGQYGLALKFERIIKSSISLKNENFHITLLLLNGLIMEAYSTLKKNCFGDKQLLQHFFKVCDELGHLKEIFKFPLLPEEEEEFIAYLDNCTSKDSGDLKILYLLSRGRYVEAVDINHNMNTKVPKFGIVGNNTTKQDNSGRTTTRDLLVNAFSKTLPNVTNDLINICRKERDKIYRYKHVVKPTPLSVIVHVDADKEIPVYKSSFESVMQAAICKTAETWSSFPRVDKRNKNISFTQNTPFLRSEIVTPKRKQSDISFRSLVKDKENKDKKKDADEPPTKKVRRNLQIASDSICEMDEEDLLQSAPLEVTKILRTPHVQKRLNKLLENTPESSPLTSILKSSEVSRFKQPPKVGFSVPEVHKRTPLKKMVDASTHVSTPHAENRLRVEEPSVKKSLIEDFERSQQVQAEEVKIGHANISDSSENSSAVESYKSTEKDDSYYSLESVNDNENVMSFMLEDSEVKVDVVNKSSRMFIECMSEEDIECTSPTEQTIVQEEPATTGFQASWAPDGIPLETEAGCDLQTSWAPDVVESAPSTELEAMETEQLEYESLKPVEEQTYSNVEIRNDSNAAVGVITSTFSHYGQEFHQNDDKKYTYEAESYEADFEKDDEIDVERDNEDRSSNVDVSDYSQENESENDQKESSSEPEASDEEDKSQDEEELAGTEKASSFTEVTESSEEDSDIEIIEDNTTPVIQTSHVLRNNERSRKMEDDNDERASERTYESEYSYSDESLAEESEIEEQSVAEEESNIYVEDSNDVEYDNEVEYEEEANEGKEISEYERESFYQNNPQINYEELKNIVSSIAAAESNEIEEAKEDEIENIVISNETFTIEKDDMSMVNSTVNESAPMNISGDNESIVANTSMSVCSVYDQSQSIIEETVHMSEANANISEQNQSVQVINETIDSNYSIVNVTNVTDSKIEDKSGKTSDDTGTSLVFYFGENSVTSIGDDVLTEERDTSANSHKTVSVEDDKSEKPLQEPVQAESATQKEPNREMEVDEKHQEYASVEEPERYSAIEQSMEEAAALKYSSGKEHGFLRTSVPECNVHIIEKVRNEMYSSDDGYDDSDVQPDQGSDENHEINIAEEPRIITLEDEEKQITSVPAENLQINDEVDEIELSQNSAASNQTCVAVMGAEERSQHISSLISEKDITVDVSIVRMSQSPHALMSAEDLVVDTIEKEVKVQDSEKVENIEPAERQQTPVKKNEKPVLITDAGLFEHESPIVAIKRSEEPIPSPSPVQSHEVLEPTPSPSPVESHEVLDNVEFVPCQLPVIVEPVPQPSTVVSEQGIDEHAEIAEEPSRRRRSVRIAKRRSLDCIPTAVQEDDDMDDAMSIKSGSSVAESVTSRVSVASGSSTQSNRSRRTKSFSRMELRKSTTTHHFKQLEVIMSDEEMTSPQKTEVGKVPTTAFYPKYAASEPGGRPATTKRKRSARSVHDGDEDDRLSSVSESGGRKQAHKRNVRRKSDLISTDDAMITPLKVIENKRLGKFVSSTPLVMNTLKGKPSSKASAEVEEYTNSRRLTRSQKMYMEYSLSNRESNNASLNLPSSSGIRASAKTQKLEEIEENEPDYSLSIDEDIDKMNSPKPSPQKLADPHIKPISTRRRTPVKKEQLSVPTRFSRRLSGRFDSPANDDSFSSEEPPSPAKSVSSTSSRASTASRQSQRGRRSYTSMELRKSSVRPNFKPLAVIPSDDESQSFQQPTPTKNLTDESLLSSPGSTISKASTASRSRRRSTSKVSDVSDKESSFSDTSSATASSVSSRKRANSSKTESKKSKVKATEKAAVEPTSSVSTYTKNRRLTRTQKSKMEQTLKETSRKKKK